MQEAAAAQIVLPAALTTPTTIKLEAANRLADAVEAVASAVVAAVAACVATDCAVVTAALELRDALPLTNPAKLVRADEMDVFAVWLCEATAIEEEAIETLSCCVAADEDPKVAEDPPPPQALSVRSADRGINMAKIFIIFIIFIIFVILFLIFPKSKQIKALGFFLLISFGSTP